MPGRQHVEASRDQSRSAAARQRAGDGDDAVVRIAIVGAGIGGLAAAAGLQRAGAEVTVFERAPEVRAGGSGLSIFANGLAALDFLGLGAQLAAISDSSVEGLAAGQRRADGRWIARVPRDAVSALRIVDRADLHRILLAALAPGTVRTGAEATAATTDGTLSVAPGPADFPSPAGSAVSPSPAGSADSAASPSPAGCADSVAFSNSADSTASVSPTDSPASSGRRSSAESAMRTPFDLIIGADGLHSRMRTVIAGQTVAPRYSGYSAWRGITSVTVDLRGAAGESVGHGRRFGIAPLADGRVYWFAVANMPENAVFADEKGTVEQMFTGWHCPIGELIDATDAEAIHRTPISDLSRRLAGFCRGRVVLVGDAAHAMTPNLGQGGGQALEDAATLTALLTPWLNQGGEISRLVVDDVLRRYDSLRRPRAQAIALRSRLMGQVFQLESPLAAWMRDAVFSAVPARFIAAQAASVQKWSPPTPTC